MAKVSGKDAPKSPGRLQGVKADIEDLVLRASGKRLELEVGPGITPTPTLTRTIDGASSISIDVFDPDRKLLRSSLLSQKWEAEIDGLGFRYVGCSKSGQTLTLTLEDEWVAKLKEHHGPVKVLRKHSTRAEFIKRLVEEACPGLDFYCPQLHRKQPIGTKAEKADRKKEAKELKQEARENRGPGIGDTKHLNIEGVKLTKSQVDLAETALHIANSVSAPFRVQVALISALIAESTLGAGSSNVLQAEQEINGPGGEGAKVRPAADEISGFLTGKPHWTGTTAIDYYKKHPNAQFYEIAQAVQGSEFTDGSNYAKHGSESREIVEAFWGESGGPSTITVFEAVRFEVKGKEKGKPPESYWAAIKRMAKEVNWRFFISDRAYFVPETELIRSATRLAIDEDTPGVEYPEIGFEYNVHAEVTEVTVPAFVTQWKPPPGTVVTVAGLGPVSLGPGDPPGKKSAKTRLSSNVKASTHEGRGRYLVSKIEVPLSGDPAQRLAQITLRTPSRPLPEPQPTRKTGSRTGSAGSAPPGIQKAIEECDAIDARQYEYSSPGARGTPPPAEGPYDCSGITSRIVYVACGEPTTTLASEELAHFGQGGPGEWLTIFAKGPNGPSGHAFLRIKTADGWRYFGTSSTNPGGGAGWVDDSAYSSGYLAEFQQRHPRGF